MKKYLLLLVVLLGSVCAYSQNKMVEAIHLKNGSVIKGVIILFLSCNGRESISME